MNEFFDETGESESDFAQWVLHTSCLVPDKTGRRSMYVLSYKWNCGIIADNDKTNELIGTLYNVSVVKVFGIYWEKLSFLLLKEGIYTDIYWIKKESCLPLFKGGMRSFTIGTEKEPEYHIMDMEFKRYLPAFDQIEFFHENEILPVKDKK